MAVAPRPPRSYDDLPDDRESPGYDDGEAFDEYDDLPTFDAALGDYDDEDYDEDEEERGGRTRMLIAGGVGALVLAGGVGWYFLSGDSPEAPPSSLGVPTVTAERDPFKRQPNDPGGMEVPNTDMSVYDRLSPGDQGSTGGALPGGGTDRAPERIFSDNTSGATPQEQDQIAAMINRSDPAQANRPSQPLPSITAPDSRSQPAPGQPTAPPRTPGTQTSQTPGSQTGTPQADTASPAQPAPQPTQPQRASPPLPPAAKPTPPAAVQQRLAARREQERRAAEDARRQEEEKRQAEAQRQAAARQQQQQQAARQPEQRATSSLPSVSGRYLVQVASFQNPQEAQGSFERLKRQQPSLFSGLSLDVQRADLGNRGVWYRLRVGPFPSRAAAAQRCRQMKAQNMECLVVVR